MQVRRASEDDLVKPPAAQNKMILKCITKLLKL